MFETFWKDEDVELKFEFADDRVFAHATVTNWNKSKYKKFVSIWLAAKEELSNNGYLEIFVAIPDNDKKLYKFEQLFGFSEIAHVNNMFLMATSTE